MASADICSSATTPRVYASTTQSIWASDSTCPSRLARMTSTAANSLIPTCFVTLTISDASHRRADAFRRFALAGPGQAAVRVHHHDPGRTDLPPGHRGGRRGREVRRLLEDALLRVALARAAGRPLPVAGPDLLAAGQIGVHEDRAPARATWPARSAPPAPPPARSPCRGRPGRTRAAAARPSSAAAARASTRHSGPPCSQSSCRQRPHGISGEPVASTQETATSRPPPVACSAVTSPHSAHRPDAVRGVLHVAADHHPAVVDQPRHPDRKVGVRGVRVPHGLDGGGPQPSPVDLHAAEFCLMDLGG